MKIYVPHATLLQLQTGRLSAAIDSAADIDISDVCRQTPGVLWLAFRPEDDGYIVAPIGDAVGLDGCVALKTPPSGTMVFWSLSTGPRPGLTPADDLVSELNALYPRNRFHSGSGPLHALLAWLLREALKSESTFSRRATDLNSALFQLRKEHEQTRTVLYNMQDILYSLRNSPPRQTSFTRPGRRSVNHSTLMEHGADSATQPLLVSSNGLTGIDIYVKDACAMFGLLNFDLLNSATGELIAKWRCVYTKVREGWLHLPLSAALPQDHLSLTLKVTFFSPHAASPGLGLADQAVIGGEHLSIRGEPQRGMRLAMRTWAGFPGTRSHARTANRFVDTQLFEYGLPVSLLSKLVLADDYGTPLKILDVDEAGAVLLHPLPNRAIAAYISGALPHGLRKVEAEVIVTGECSSPVEFAIAAVAQGSDPATIDPSGEMCISSSGWLPVSGNFVRELIGFEIDDNLEFDALDLYLFSRVPGGMSADFAHARFLSVRAFTDVETAAIVQESGMVLSGTDSGPDSGPDPVPDRIKDAGRDLLRHAQPLNKFSVDFTPFSFLEDRGLLVHPITDVINAGVIEGIVPANAGFLHVRVSVGIHCVSNVEFGVAVPIGRKAVSRDELFSLDSGDLLIATKKIGIGRSAASFTLQLDGMTEGGENLYLFTRLPPGGPMDYADSYFDSISFDTSPNEER